jgi:hypothetical protein
VFEVEVDDSRVVYGWFTVVRSGLRRVRSGSKLVRGGVETGSRWCEVGLRRFEVGGWEWFHRSSKGSQSYAVVLKCFVVVLKHLMVV